MEPDAGSRPSGPDRTGSTKRIAVVAGTMDCERWTGPLSVCRSGRLPLGGVAAMKSLSHASTVTNVAQPAMHVGQRRKIGHRWRLATIERVLNSGSPATCLNINEVGHVARSDTQAQCRPFDCATVKKLRVGPHRCDGGHLVDDDLARRGVAQHRQQSNGRVVAAALVDCRLAASGYQVQADTRGVSWLRNTNWPSLPVVV